MSPNRRFGPGREGRDDDRRRRDRLDMAFQEAKKILDKKREELKAQGFTGKELEERVGNLGETADSLYKTKAREPDCLAEEKRKKVRQQLEKPKDTSFHVGKQASKEMSNLATGFKERLDEKRTQARHKKEANESKPVERRDSKREDRSRRNVTDSRSEPFKDIFKDVRYLQREKTEFLKESTTEQKKSVESKIQNRGKDVEKLKRSQTEFSKSPQEIAKIHTKEQFDEILQRHSNIEFSKIYDKQYSDVKEYFEKENTKNPDKPSLVVKLENLEIRDMYRIVYGRLPEVSIESMDDVDKYLKKHPETREQPKFSESYRHCEIYFEVRDDRSKTEKDLAKEHDISESAIGRYRRRDAESRLISALRSNEENTIIREWANSYKLDEATATKLEHMRHIEVQTTAGDTIDRPSVGVIESRISDESFRSIRENDEFGKGEVLDLIESLIRESPESRSRIFAANLQDSGLDINKLSDIENILKLDRKVIQESLMARLEHIDDIRFGFIKEKIYVWIPESEKNDMLCAWQNQYFCFNNRTLSIIVDKVGTQLELGKTKFEKYQNLSDLTQQMIQSSYSPFTMKKSSSRILGEALHLQRDILGLKTMDFERNVSKITGANGVGGINNPRLLEGKELEVERARLFAVIKSDGWVSHDGKVGYVQKNLDRFNIVEKNLQVWGDFKLTRYHDNVKRAYETKLPSPFWDALTFWGFSPGDKLMHNEGLPFDIGKLSPESMKTYLGELIPEDGNFHPSTGFTWSRSVVIDAGKKTKDYKFKSLVKPELKEFIRENAHDIEGLRKEPRKELLIGELQNIIDSPQSKEPDRDSAEELMRVIRENPCRLLEDEAEMARKMAINVETNPREIRYYLNTGRISVIWRGRTCSNDDAEKWGIQFSPNDTKKRGLVKHWLLERRESVERTKLDLQSKGVLCDEWWL